MATLTNLTAEIDKLHEEISRLETNFYENVNSFFLCSMALIIFCKSMCSNFITCCLSVMQCGFAYLEAGAVRSKNTTNILIKNLLDSCICIIGYWAIGWALAYGDSGDGVNLFVGHSQFFLSGFSDYPRFFFQYVFSATAATIVSGAVAERCEFVTYVTYCTVISSQFSSFFPMSKLLLQHLFTRFLPIGDGRKTGGWQKESPVESLIPNTM